MEPNVRISLAPGNVFLVPPIPTERWLVEENTNHGVENTNHAAALITDYSLLITHH